MPPSTCSSRSTALVRRGRPRLLAAHQVDGDPGPERAARAAYPDREQFATGDPGALLPLQPGRRSAQRRSRRRSPSRSTASACVGRGTLRAPYTGPPGTVHGGVVAMVLDELLGAVERVPRPRCVHRHADRPLRATDARSARSSTFDAWVDRTEGRKVFTVGTISAGGDGHRARRGRVHPRRAPIPAD